MVVGWGNISELLQNKHVKNINNKLQDMLQGIYLIFYVFNNMFIAVEITVNVVSADNQH